MCFGVCPSEPHSHWAIVVDVVPSGVVSSVSGLPDCHELVLQEGLGFIVGDVRV